MATKSKQRSDSQVRKAVRPVIPTPRTELPLNDDDIKPIPVRHGPGQDLYEDGDPATDLARNGSGHYAEQPGRSRWDNSGDDDADA